MGDIRRKNLVLGKSFFSLAETALDKLKQIEVELTSTDLPRNSAALAEKHAQLSGAIVEVSTPVLRGGHILLERVGKDNPAAQGVNNIVTNIQELCTKLEELCKARYEAGEKSQAYNQFQEKLNTDLKSKSNDFTSLASEGEALTASEDQPIQEALTKLDTLKTQWTELIEISENRITLGQHYVVFHKKAQQLAIKMDALV